MRAAVTTRYGLPDVVEVREVPTPTPADIDAGKLRTVIGRRFTLDEIFEAHRYADTGHKIGNVAVLIGAND